jgi:hypothetical protein
MVLMAMANEHVVGLNGGYIYGRCQGIWRDERIK